MTTIDNTKTVTTYLIGNIDTMLSCSVINVTYKYSAILIIFIKLKMA